MQSAIHYSDPHEVSNHATVTDVLHPTLVAPEPVHAHRRLWCQPVRTGFNWFVPRVNNTALTTIHVSISHIYNALLNTTVCVALCARTQGVIQC